MEAKASYARVDNWKKKRLIHYALVEKRANIKETAAALGIKYENARAIIRRYKIARNQILSRTPLDENSGDHSRPIKKLFRLEFRDAECQTSPVHISPILAQAG